MRSASPGRASRHALLTWSQWAGCFAALGLGLGLADGANADDGLPPGVEVRWEAPPDCPQAGDVRAALAARWLREAPEGPLTVDGRVVCVRGESCQLVLRLTGVSEGLRTLHADSCGDMATATAVLVALAVDAAAPAPPLEPEPEPEGEPEPPSGASAWTWGLQPRFVVDVGTLPRAQPGGGLAVWLGHGALQFGLQGAGFRPSRKMLEGGVASVTYSTWEVAAVACGLWPGGRVRVGPCAGVGVTSLTGRSRGVVNEVDATRWSATPRLGVRLHVQLVGRLSLGLHAQALLPLPRSSWSLQGFDDVHQVSPVVGRFGISLGVWL